MLINFMVNAFLRECNFSRHNSYFVGTMRNVSFQIIVRHEMHFPEIPVNKCMFRSACLKWPFSVQNQIYEGDRGGFYFKMFKCNFPWKFRFPCNLESFPGLQLAILTFLVLQAVQFVQSFPIFRTGCPGIIRH